MKKSILTLTLLTIFSCSSSDGNNSPEEPLFDGSIDDIEAFYNLELVNAMKQLGFVFNLGNNPPNIEGTYEASPMLIQASTTGRDSIGTRLADQIITLSNQNNDSLTIDFKIEGNGQTSFGKGSFVSGNNDEFSIFIKSETQNKNSIAVETATSISGKISNQKILNLQFAGLMLDDRGDPDEQYIENNTGRLIYDSDEISPVKEPSVESIFSTPAKIHATKNIFSENQTN